MKQLDSRWLLPVLILLYSMNFMDRSVLSIVGDALKADLSLSDGELGLLHSVLLITLIFLIIPGAALCDVLGRRRMLAIAAGLWTGAMALTGTAAGLVHLIGARALGSINEASVGAGGNAWLASWYPAEKRGRCIGIFQMSAPLGMALGTLLGGVILAWTGSWRAAFFLFIVPGLFCVLTVPRLPDRQAPAGKGYFRALPKLLKIRTLVFCGLGAGCYCIVKFAYQTWLPVLIMRSYEGISPWMAGAMAGSFLLMGAAGPVIGGSFSDWCARRGPSGRIRAIVACLGLVAASKFVLYWMTGLVPLSVLFAYGLFDGLLTMAPLPIYFTIAQDVVEDRFRAGACGLMGGIIYLTGGAWGPLLVGFFSDSFGGGAQGLRMAELVLLAFLLVSMLIFSLAAGSYARERRTDAEAASPDGTDPAGAAGTSGAAASAAGAMSASCAAD
ncbi:MAG: MFS transporter [Desulfovibrionaceae bacterium]|nr:MFS transporter [Desulfovibrionaceae bacterium]